MEGLECRMSWFERRISSTSPRLRPDETLLVGLGGEAAFGERAGCEMTES
jgi:hypothetical protein